MAQIRVLLVDDRQLVRQGIGGLLRQNEEIDVVGGGPRTPRKR
jgi:DNA-binding NarL/FixJ family response regulator